MHAHLGTCSSETLPQGGSVAAAIPSQSMKSLYFLMLNCDGVNLTEREVTLRPCKSCAGRQARSTGQRRLCDHREHYTYLSSSRMKHTPLAFEMGYLFS